ncbi:uncharacterized protein LOC121377447 [Gigantopelta aegis]|uniref:uncharacterized protein LOC121377447 n=1 Tax=Gigantopelta aegis TaxID=1735272 RepID=UPI001B888EAE|nr:uncharacterized protein LOC121377447 [Gigantopelta aegis]
MRELFTSGCLLLLCCTEGMIGEDHRNVLLRGRGRKNWALHKPTRQSSENFGWYKSMKAVDGRLDNDVIKSKSCIVTRYERRPWWIVDLKVTIRVQEVFIMNRGTCCAVPYNFHIEVHKGTFAQLELVGLCHYQSEPLQYGMTNNFRCHYDLIGQFVRLWIDKWRAILSVCEVEVYGSKYINRNDWKGTNWARVEEASQSSTNLNNGLSNPNNAVDGNLNSEYIQGSCSHTRIGDTSPWWQIDLLQLIIVTDLKLFNRMDCCRERLHDFVITILQNSSDTNAKQCYKQTRAVLWVETIKCHVPLAGQIVRVAKTSVRGPNDVLTLCEVEVFGWKIVTDPEYLKSRDNFAVGRSAWLSSVSADGQAWRAVDGNILNNWYGGSCVSTKLLDRHPWFKVFFGPMFIEAVLVVFRAECCENHVPKLYVWVDEKVLCGRQNKRYVRGAVVGYACPSNTQGAYALITKAPIAPPREVITLCEVEVYGFIKTDKNWALGSRVVIEDMDNGTSYDGHFVTDGDFSNFFKQPVCPTFKASNYLLMTIDLRDVYVYVEKIVYITAIRNGAVAPRELSISLVNLVTQYTNDDACRPTSRITGPGQHFTVRCWGSGTDRLANRIVMKKAFKTNSMSICEVEVYGPFAYRA